MTSPITNGLPMSFQEAALKAFEIDILNEIPGPIVPEKNIVATTNIDNEEYRLLRSANGIQIETSALGQNVIIKLNKSLLKATWYACENSMTFNMAVEFLLKNQGKRFFAKAIIDGQEFKILNSYREPNSVYFLKRAVCEPPSPNYFETTELSQDMMLAKWIIEAA